MQMPRRSGKVLVTEDNPLHMKIFKLNLSVWGFEVCEAANGEVGLALARSEKPDLILADLSLPKLDGWEMIRRLKDDDATKDIPIIVISARHPQDEAARATALRIDAFVSKPFDPEALVRLVADTMTGR